jgi:hypothetical protein
VNVDGRGLTVEDLKEFGVWIVTLVIHHTEDADDQGYISDVEVCARDVAGAEAAARKWVVDDGMIPLRVVQIRYICGVRAVNTEATKGDHNERVR